MASGTVSLGISGKLEGKIEWESTVQGSTAQEKASLNKSNVTAKLYIRRIDQYYTLGIFNYFWQIGASSNTLGWYGRIENYNWVKIDEHTEVVKHNDDGTGSCYMTCTLHGPSGTSMSGNTISGTQTVTLDTIPRYATCSFSESNLTETSMTINWTSDSTCDYVWYSINNGSSYVSVGSTNANNGSFSITGLTAGTPYPVKVKVRRKDSQLPTESSKKDITTYNYPYFASGSTYIIKDGRNLALAVNNPLSKNITMRIKGEDGTVIRTVTGAIGSYSTTFDSSERDLWYSSITNKLSGTYKIEITNEVGTTTVNGNTYTANEEDCTPTFNDFTYEDTNTTTTYLTGDSSIVVVGYSNIRATVTPQNKATGKNYADIKEYELRINGNTSTDIQPYSDDSNVVMNLNSAQSGVIQVYARDYRGFTKLVEKSLSSEKVKTPTPIQKGNISIERQNNVGEQVTLTFDGTYWNQSFGSLNNIVSGVTYRFKKTTDSTWTTGTTLIQPTMSNGTYTFSNSIEGDIAGVGFDSAYSYNIEVIVSDYLTSVKFTTTLGSGTPTIALVDDGISFLSKYDTNDTTNKVQINGNTKITGNENVNGDIDITGNYKVNGTPLSIPTLDSSVSTASTNGVENQAITNYVNSKHSDTGWVDLSSYVNTSNFAIRSDSPQFKPMARKIGNVVYWRGSIYCHTRIQGEQGVLLRNIPSQFMPNREVAGSGNHYGLARVFSIWTEGNEIHINDGSTVETTGFWQGYSLSCLGPYTID